MWIFRSTTRNAYLAANPKVLTQTLLRQKTLERFLSNRRYLHFLLKEIHPSLGPEYVMIVRNPYRRVESYFKEKLRQKVMQALDASEAYTLKRHQVIFYDFLKIKPSDPLQEKVSRLMQLDFKSFVSLIPELYAQEDHLAPQTYNYTRNFLFSRRTMKMNKYVRIESSEEMKWISDHFGLDLSIRLNDSSGVKENIKWDNESIAIIQKVYENDFRTFGYELSPELVSAVKPI